jgi:hypothetical protein
MPQIAEWRTLNCHSYYPFHQQIVQALQHEVYSAHMEFCIIQNDQLIHLLFTNEAMFTKDGITNHRNSHSWAVENSNEINEIQFQHRFSVNVWFRTIDNIVIGPFVFEHHVSAERYLNFLDDSRSELLEDVPLEVRLGIWFQHNGATAHFASCVRKFLNQLD